MRRPPRRTLTQHAASTREDSECDRELGTEPASRRGPLAIVRRVASALRVRVTDTRSVPVDRAVAVVVDTVVAAIEVRDPRFGLSARVLALPDHRRAVVAGGRGPAAPPAGEVDSLVREQRGERVRLAANPEGGVADDLEVNGV